MKKKILALFVCLALALTMAPLALAANFTDVPEDHPMKAAIDYCADNGFIKGYSATRFEPNGNLTRGQLCVIWGRTMHYRMPAFTDVTRPKNEIDNAVYIMYATGIVNGVKPTVFSLNSNITREQMATIVARTYIKGAGGNEYLEYSDAASISEYARDAISVCKRNGVFDNAFTGTAFQPTKAITRGETCQIVYNLMSEKFNVIIPTFTNGTITAHPMEAVAGQTVHLTITPDTGYRLVAGSLKFNGTNITGTSFKMPAADATLSALFEPIPALTSIVVTSPPDIDTYVEGDTLDLKGLEITAHFSDGSEEVVTDYTTSPAAGAALTAASPLTVTVSLTRNGVTETTTFDVTVDAAPFRRR